VLSKRHFLVTVGILLFAFALWAQKAKDAPPAGYKIPPEAAAKANPVKPSEESLARGKRLYGLDCTMGHGNNGDGKGRHGFRHQERHRFHQSRIAKESQTRRTLLRHPQRQRRYAPEGDRAKADDIWNMVNYIRSLAKK
jgi:cytochrome c5